MTEREMEDLLWKYPEKFLNETLTQFRRQQSSQVGRIDLVFEDRLGRLLIIEMKKGKLQRGAIEQLHDYYGMLKKEFPDKSVELMVVAHIIHDERRLACEKLDIECREISEKKFRDVAEEMGYVFESEAADTKAKKEKLVSSGFVPTPPPDAGKDKAMRWSFAQAAQSTENAADFLSRCDEPARAFFSRLFEKQRTIANKTRITWKHESGFSMQFYFPRLGFVEMVWGFPQVNREGNPSRNAQSLVFPFDFAARRGVPGEYINAFGEILDAVHPLSGGKRPSMRVVTLEATEADRVLEAIFDFALRASTAKA